METALTSVGSLTLGSPVVLGVGGGIAALFAVFFVVRMIRNRKSGGAPAQSALPLGVSLKNMPFLQGAEAILQEAAKKAVEDATRKALATMFPGLSAIITQPIIDMEDKLLDQIGGQLPGGSVPPAQVQPAPVVVPPGHDVIAVPKGHPVLDFLRSALEARQKAA